MVKVLRSAFQGITFSGAEDGEQEANRNVSGKDYLGKFFWSSG